MQVRAARRITEEGFREAELYVHAEPGDVGEVLEVADVGPGWLMVRWSRGDSVSMCHTDELTIAQLAVG